MVSTNRRTLLKGGAAFAGASALGFPAIVRAQAAKIKIGHLVPLTGFLGAIGGYAQLGVKLAAEEINAAGGIDLFGCELHPELGIAADGAEKAGQRHEMADLDLRGLRPDDRRKAQR